MRGVIDVELVDLADRRGADADGHRPRPDHRGEAFTLAGRERLRVPDARDPMTARTHDHGRRDHGPTGRCDADLVHADDPGQALVPESALVAEGRDDRSHRRLG
jgi:hypothetical protein